MLCFPGAKQSCCSLQRPEVWAQCPEWQAPAGKWEAKLEADAQAEAAELTAAEAEMSVPQVCHLIRPLLPAPSSHDVSVAVHCSLHTLRCGRCAI